ncbi:MAG TPA: envelope integrity protein Cei [Pseudonocardiaceae bacterium]
MAALNTSPVRRSTWYRARNPVPAILLILVLAAVAGSVWLGVLNPSRPAAMGCQEAAKSLAVGPAAHRERLPPAGLDHVAPSPPQQVTVQVLNANGKRGEAGVVAADLAGLGFAPTASPTNDPLYPAFGLHCTGEIRFGTAGEAAARTLSLAVPCAELVRDARPDAMVDLALGTAFAGLRPNDAAREALRGLAQLDQPAAAAPARGGQAGEPVVPAVDPELLQKARQAGC